MGGFGLLVLIAVVALVLVGAVGLVRQIRRRQREPEAGTRARSVAQAALDAFHSARSANPSLGVDELRLRALMAASGESAAQTSERIEKAKGLSPLHSSLQMLVVGVAVRNERARADVVGSQQLMKNIVAAQKAVMALIQGDL